MSLIRRLSLTIVTALIIAGSFLFSTVAADAAATPSATLQEEMQYLNASRLAEEENLLAVLWVQRSAEFRGLSYQAYNLAAMEIDKAVAQRRKEETALRKARAKENLPAQHPLRPLAVVLDIDDTIVCHALFEAYFIIKNPEGKATSDVWEQWIGLNKDLLPGARDFLNYARSRGIQIFYVTGRGPQDKEATIGLFRRTGLPFTDESHLLMNDGSGSKMNHFLKLARRYDVICYLGDNAGDFPIGASRVENVITYQKAADNQDQSGTVSAGSGPENTKRNEVKIKQPAPLDIHAMLKHDKNKKRNAIIDANKKLFGTRFILLPNPMYGDWENNLAQKYRKLPADQRIALRKAAMKCFAYKEK